MTNNKQTNWKNLEIVILLLILAFIVVNGVLKQDSIIAIISALCGITYTFIAGKGNPICYLFGITGSTFYCLLAYNNALWGNLLLYALYYVPMQVLGFFQWNKNLKNGRNDIIKIILPKREMYLLIAIMLLLTGIVYYVLMNLQDAHPLLDSITTVFSIGGMYLTVRRALEQWIFWMAVNSLSLAMWLNVALQGTKVYSTVIMWGVYLFLAFYFYFSWKKEIKNIL